VRKLIVGMGLAAFLCGCSSEAPAPKPATTETKVAKPAAQPTDFKTGRLAFQSLFIAAHNWAPDARAVRVESRPRAEDKRDGKASVWTATFASPGKRSIRNFLWSGAQAEDAPESGITPGSIGDYSPTNVSTQPFDYAFLKTDTDQALEVANHHGGKEVLAKDAKLPLKYELEWEPRQGRLIWKVIYGSSENNAKLTVLVNASTNTFVKATK